MKKFFAEFHCWLAVGAVALLATIIQEVTFLAGLKQIGLTELPTACELPTGRDAWEILR
jgi:hypothetical protein